MTQRAWALGLPMRGADAVRERGPVAPFERDDVAATSSPVAMTPLDGLVEARLAARGIAAAYACSDAVFVRRAYLDVIGALPEPADVRGFLEDERADKRARLVDALLARPEFAEYWTLKWCDLLRVKAEFPINLWPNAVQAYHRWIRNALQKNWPYDRFVRALLTSSGSNFREPAVNFYRALQGREAADIAGAVALTFLGERLESWPAQRRDELAVFFSQVGYKRTSEWKEEIVLWQPALTAEREAVLPDGTAARLTPDDDPRRVFANWLITPDNPYFARTIVNRLWSWLLGRGIIHEPDDARPDNPPSNPELLAYLEKELVGAQYDLQHVYRLILNSRTYQQSSIARSDDPESEALFAYYPVRRLDAEVLADALAWVGGTGERYTSLIPEPATYIPEDERSVELADGSITSPFLEMFGRPPRDTGLESERSNEPNDAQRLHLLNSSDVYKKIERSPLLKEVQETAKKDRRELVRGLYLATLSRYPTDVERERAVKYLGRGGPKRREGVHDLAWALINTKEFLYRH